MQIDWGNIKQIRIYGVGIVAVETPEGIVWATPKQLRGCGGQRPPRL